MEIDQNHNTSEFLDLLPEIVFEIDTDLNVRFLNKSCKRILGYNRNDFINKPIPIEKIIVLDDIPKLKENIKKTFSGIPTSGNTYRIINKNDKEIILEIYSSLIKKNGKIIGLRSIAINITEKENNHKRLLIQEKHYRELNATKDKFFSIIAHDLKNPFNDLMGFTQLLALNIEKYDKNRIKQFVDIIHQSSKLAYNLLENLLDWSSSQTGSLKFNPEKILINDLVNENIDLLESTAKNKNKKIYSELSNDIYAIADKNMVRTIIRNLISNSIKYTYQGGFIKILSSYEKGFCKISVSDNGIGISNENIDKIFKIDESHSTLGTEKETGTGLGLILCKEFVEKNGGKLWVKSEPDKGSIFSFTLPLPKPDF